MVGFPQSKGVFSRQGQIGTPEGTYEEQYSRFGFAGDQAMLYRRHSSTKWSRIEGEFRSRVADTNEIVVPDMSDPRALPTTLLSNDDVAICLSRRSEPMPYYFRDVDGDEVIMVQRGQGEMHTDFGVLPFRPGDYLVVPKGINYRLVPEGSDNMFYLVRTRGQIGFPDRGGLGHFVPFDLGVLDTPDPRPSDPADDQEWEILVRREDTLTSVFYPFDPMDVVGWQGSICPFRLSMYDIRNVSSERIDIPPSGFATFETRGCLICTFTPHQVQIDPDSTYVPPLHRNVDADEATFILATEDGKPVGRLDPGRLFLTPQGAHHGPDAPPIRPERWSLYTMMTETERPLMATPEYEKYARDRES